jgi:hypothetical protein
MYNLQEKTLLIYNNKQPYKVINVCNNVQSPRKDITDIQQQTTI